jgi:type I restriction enzyme S subunit
MSFPKYPAYQQTGIEWLGSVPAHWKVIPLRTAARLESGHTPSRNHAEYWVDCTVPWFSLADVWQIRELGRTVITETAEKISELGIQNSAARRLPAGTVMLSRTASVGFAAIMGVEMATTQDFANWVCGPRLLPQYLLNVFRAMSGEFKRLMMGSTHNTIYMPDIAAFRIGLPPVAEQRAIADFLDRETAKIDALVAEQERLIDLLKEKRQAVISHAVTKGLNPDAPMKDSGIEWLGQVPAHWEVRRLKSLLSDIKTGPFGSALTKDMYTTEGYRVYGQEQVIPSDFSVGDYFIRPDLFADLQQYAVEPGDVLVSCVGTFGKVAVVPVGTQPGIINPRLIRLRCGPLVSSSYLALVLRSQVTFEQFSAVSRGGTMDTINAGTLSAISVALPPTAEQETILRYVVHFSEHSDALGAEAQRAIEVLQERRAALISAAVTGQIDVRPDSLRTAA